MIRTENAVWKPLVQYAPNGAKYMYADQCEKTKEIFSKLYEDLKSFNLEFKETDNSRNKNKVLCDYKEENKKHLQEIKDERAKISKTREENKKLIKELEYKIKNVDFIARKINFKKSLLPETGLFLVKTINAIMLLTFYCDEARIRTFNFIFRIVYRVHH